VERCVLWCDRARITLLGHESRAPFMRNIVFRDLDILRFALPAFLLEPGEEMRLENVRFEKIRIHGHGQQDLAVVRPVINQYMRTKAPGHIRQIVFDSISVRGVPGDYRMVFSGADDSHTTQDVLLRNLTFPDGTLRDDSPRLHRGPHIDRVRVEGE
jgi:hypothetical protein